MKIFNIFKKKKKQTTYCYCPKCGNELISSGSFVEDNELVKFKCLKCNEESEWLFDCPIPILIKKL